MRTPISRATLTARWCFGLRRVLFEGYELYGVRGNTMRKTLKNYGRGTPQDWLERRPLTAPTRTFGIVVFVAAHLVLFRGFRAS